MSQITLEAVMERLEKLEQTVNRLLQNGTGVEQIAPDQPKSRQEPLVFKDWRKAIEFKWDTSPEALEFRAAWEEAMREASEADRQAAIEEADREDAEREGRG